MNKISFTPEAFHVEATARSFYEESIAKTLLTLWRHQRLITAIAMVGFLLGLVWVSIAEKRYTSEAVIQLDFARAEAAKVGAPMPMAAMEASALVEGDARLIRSRLMARRVVERLHLVTDHEFAPGPSSLSAIYSYATGGSAAEPLDRTVERATEALTKQVTVSNDAKSYLISITAKATTPEKAAELANAFAAEYLQDRLLQKLRQGEAEALGALNLLLITYGEKHPSVIQANANLDSARKRIEIAQGSAEEQAGLANFLPGQLVSAAQPSPFPTGPGKLFILALATLGALLAGVFCALFLEKRKTGLRSEEDVKEHTGLRCVGMVPTIGDVETSGLNAEQSEALRSFALAAGLADRNGSARTVMVTSSLPDEGKSDFVSGFARLQLDQGNRVLIIDTNPRNPNEGGQFIDDLIETRESMQAFFEKQKNIPMARLFRAQCGPGDQIAIATKGFENLCKEALSYYDLVLIEAPPAIMLADAVVLGRIANCTIQIARWNSTPRKTVANTVRRLRDASVLTTGVVLTDVDLAGPRVYGTSDYFDDVSKYRDYMSKNRDQLFKYRKNAMATTRGLFSK